MLTLRLRIFSPLQNAFQALMHNGGFGHRRLQDELGVHVPIVDAGAKFLSPLRYEDRLVVEAKVVHWGTKCFRIAYKGVRANVPVFEGYEARVWARIATDGTIATVAIAPEFKTAIAAAGG